MPFHMQCPRKEEKEKERNSYQKEGGKCIVHTVALSLALQMLLIGSVKKPHACSLNPGIVREACSGLVVSWNVGVESGSSSWNSLWICVGFKAFLLSQPNVKVRM